MKGEALITIKDKNGKIKQQIKEPNMVFDVPKELLKGFISNTDIGPYNDSTPIPTIMFYQQWFGSIFLNDEEANQTTDKDWQMPILYGGPTATANSSNKRYAVADSVVTATNENVMKKGFTWNDCPAFTLKSINLRHQDISNGGSFIQSSKSGQMIKYGKYYFLAVNPDSSSWESNGNKNTLKFGQLGEKGSFLWNGNCTGRKFTGIRVACNRTTSSPFIAPAPIVALKPNNNVKEIALLRNADDVTTDDASSNTWTYLVIINATTGEKIRSFSRTQFTNYYSNSNQSFLIMATEYGNFLVGSKSGATSKISIWKIPDEATAESIPIWADEVATTDMQYRTFAIDNLLFCCKTGNHKTIKINSATAGDITTYDYIPFNVASNYNGYDFGIDVTQKSKYVDEYYSYFASGVPKWFSVTALNLSGGGVSIAAGDTLTIEYTITAN